MTDSVVLVAFLEGSIQPPEYISVSSRALLEIGYLRKLRNENPQAAVYKWTCDSPAEFFSATKREYFQRFLLLTEETDALSNWLSLRENLANLQRDLFSACEQLCSDFSLSDQTDLVMQCILEGIDFPERVASHDFLKEVLYAFLSLSSCIRV